MDGCRRRALERFGWTLRLGRWLRLLRQERMQDQDCDARILTHKVRQETPVVGVIDKRQMHCHDAQYEISEDDQIEAKPAMQQEGVEQNDAEPDDAQKNSDVDAS